MCSLWRLSEKVHITCTESAQNMLGVVVTGRPEGAGIQILVFWLLILWLLLCFHQRHWSVTIISFTVPSSWFLIITFLSWHMFWQRLSIQAPHPWQMLTSRKGSSRPERGVGERCRCGEQGERAAGVSCSRSIAGSQLNSLLSLQRLKRWGSSKVSYTVGRLHIAADSASLKAAERGFLSWRLKISFSWVLVMNYGREITATGHLVKHEI